MRIKISDLLEKYENGVENGKWEDLIMRVRIDPKQLFFNGQGQVDIRKYMLITIDDDTMLDVQDEIGLDYEEIEFVLNHAAISVLISHLPDTIEVETED